MGNSHSVDAKLKQMLQNLPENIQVELRECVNNSSSVNIFATGRSGTGKSSLINSLVGRDVATEGDTLDPETTAVKCHKLTTMGGYKVTVWDSPGLQDGTKNEAAYLRDLKTNCSDMDLCIYCISVSCHFTPGCKDLLAMKKLTDTFGTTLWDHTVIALTFANELEEITEDMIRASVRGDKEKVCTLFKEKISEWEEKIKQLMISEVGLDEDKVANIDFVPTGYHDSPRLPDRNHWMSSFWFTALYSTKQRAQPALIMMNNSRIINNFEDLRDEDVERFCHEQPLIFAARGYAIGKKYGVEDIGIALGVKAGVKLLVQTHLLLELRFVLSTVIKEKESECEESEDKELEESGRELCQESRGDIGLKG